MANKFEHTSVTTREFTLEFLKQITDSFSEAHIIGHGGYGIVYKGVLDDGEEIALKKLHHMPGLDDTQFRNEFNHLMRAQHPNITRLVGYCYDTGHQRIKYGGEYIFALVEERVLCFEYFQGGSLDKHISDASRGLDWPTRFKIIKGVCEGLNYLHNGSHGPIYHLDLKPGNILLDKNMNPKIGDFGLSRLFPSAQTYIANKIIGTPGYMPPEYIERYEITSKFDVFSLGVIIVRVMAGDEGYSKYGFMPSLKFVENVHENWGKRLQATMTSPISEQVKTCIEIALGCLMVDREKRPAIAEIVDKLNKVDTAKSSPAGEVANFRSKDALIQNSSSERRGSIAFSATYRPPMPFDIFSCPFSPLSIKDELHLTDGVSYNYNGRSIPPAALKTLLKSPKLAEEGGTTDADVDAGHVSGLIFVSERDDSLETLYIALRFNVDSRVKVFALADIFGAADFSGTRLEDSGCIGGGYSVGSRTVDHCLIYVSTKEPVEEHRRPWTVVYKTNISTGKTERLTPQGMCDLSPAVSPSGKMVAMASFENKSWNGEIENLKTDIYVMNVDNEEHQGRGRKLLIKNGGWPSWGSDNIIFFHRGTDKPLPSTSSMVETAWGVFRYDISTEETVQVTPKELDAVTPAAISESKVAVATIRQKSKYSDVRVEAQYRHIEIFDTNAPGLPPVQITQKTMPERDHYNPFVLDGGGGGGGRIGYHRCRSGYHVPQNLHKLESPAKNVGLFRVSGMFPAISSDGSKLAFVDNEFKQVWLADSEGLRIVYEKRGLDKVFCPVWNQSPDKDILYICIGPSLKSNRPLEIHSITNVSSYGRQLRRLTYGGFNNAFPSSSPGGNSFVFQSTRDFCSVKRGNSRPTTRAFSEPRITRWKLNLFPRKAEEMFPFEAEEREKKHKNLYIMVNAEVGESEEPWVTRLTKGPWTDTQCQWSPNGHWIVFSSTRDNPALADRLDSDQDPGYFSVFLVRAYDPTVVIRVMSSGADPVFSPDGRSIAMTADLAAVSADPISLPMSVHAAVVRPYGSIFVVDIDDPEELKKTKNENVIKGFRRMTHSRYECGTPAWTMTRLGTGPNSQWNMMKLRHVVNK